MPKLTLNLSEAQKREPVPDDTYRCVISDITGPHKGDKSTYVSADFEIIEGEFAGRHLYRNMPITGKGAGIFADFWEKVTGEALEYGTEGIDVDTDVVIGQEVGLVVVQEEYPEGSGSYKNEIKKIVTVY